MHVVVGAVKQKVVQRSCIDVAWMFFLFGLAINTPPYLVSAALSTTNNRSRVMLFLNNRNNKSKFVQILCKNAT